MHEVFAEQADADSISTFESSPIHKFIVCVIEFRIRRVIVQTSMKALKGRQF